MSLPALSIVIPAYNAARYLKPCLESVAEQSFADYEVIVVDDGSTDSTSTIATELVEQDSRFRLVKIDNGGVSRARNVGIDESRGHYISFVDADDLLHPQAMEVMVGALRNEKAQVCIAAFKKFSGRMPKINVGDDYESWGYEETMYRALYQKQLLNAPWGVVMERGLLGADRRFREGTRYEDLDAFYHFYDGAEKILYIPYPLYFYRDNAESFMNNWSRHRLDVLDVTERMVKFFHETYPQLLSAAQDRRFSAHFNMLVEMRRHKVDDPEAIERCRRVIREGRGRALRDGNVRLKNKIGALLSYLFLTT